MREISRDACGYRNILWNNVIMREEKGRDHAEMLHVLLLSCAPFHSGIYNQLHTHIMSICISQTYVCTCEIVRHNTKSRT